MFWKFPPPEKYVALKRYINAIDFNFTYSMQKVVQIEDKQDAKGLFIFKLDKVNFKLLNAIKICIELICCKLTTCFSLKSVKWILEGKYIMNSNLFHPITLLSIV